MLVSGSPEIKLLRARTYPGYHVPIACNYELTILIVLFGGGTKKYQQSDIDRAKELYQEYKTRKKAANKEKNKRKKR